MGKVTRGQGENTGGPEAQRLGGPERGIAKVQIGAVLLCKGAKVRETELKGGSIGKPDDWLA